MNEDGSFNLFAGAFEDGIAATVAWYRANRSWWEQIRSGAYRDYYERMYGQGGRYEGR